MSCCDKPQEMSGNFTLYQGATSANSIIRLNASGSVDTSFIYGTGFNSGIFAISIQSDGKILVGGDFTSYNGTGAVRIIRLNIDGSRDASFVMGAGFTGGPVEKIIVQADGNIIVLGEFTSYKGTPANRIIRLTSTGAIDGTFIYGTGFNLSVSSAAIQSDGKVIVTGAFTSYNGTGANRIVRLTTVGAIDGTFIYGTGFNAQTDSVAIQADGNIIVSGSFTTYKGFSNSSIIRLTTIGSIDSSFVTGTGLDTSAFSINIMTDGSIILGGGFTIYNGSSVNYIVKLTSSGAIDTSFNSGTGFNSTVFTMGLSSSDLIIYAAGDFTSYQGASLGYITSLNQNGSINNSANNPDGSSTVSIVVNGGTSSVEEINNNTLANPICICGMTFTGTDKSIFNNLLYKNYLSSSGVTESSDLNLLTKYTAMNRTDVNTVEVTGDDFKTCVLSGKDYFQWIAPAGMQIDIALSYCQYDLTKFVVDGNESSKLNLNQGVFGNQDRDWWMMAKRRKTKKKKYSHASFKYVYNR